MNPDTLIKFVRWFVIPLNTLRAIPNGDGAFVALSIGCQLCERFYRAKTKTQEKWRDQTFQDEAGDDLGVGRQQFRRFWNTFRHGQQHQGSPKKHVENSSGIHYLWQISAQFSAVPTEAFVDSTTTVIRLDPWKFADLMIVRFLNEPAILEDATSHAFGNIYAGPA